MKPTYGRVSRYGIVAFASSLDQIGPFARDARDAAALLHAIAGRDDRDSTSSPEPVPATLAALPAGDDEAAATLRGKRFGLPREYFVAGMEPGVEARVREAVAALEAAGATIEDVSLPHTDYGLATYYIVAPAEASANLARYDGIRFGPRLGDGDVLANYLATRGQGFGPEVKRRIMLGTYALSAGYYDAYYLKAQKVRTLIKGGLRRALGAGLRCARRADLADRRLPVRRPAGRPGLDVPVRCLHAAGQHGRPARRVHPVRAVRRPAGRAPADRVGLVGGVPLRARPGLRGDHRRTPRGAGPSRPASPRRRIQGLRLRSSGWPAGRRTDIEVATVPGVRAGRHSPTAPRAASITVGGDVCDLRIAIAGTVIGTAAGITIGRVARWRRTWGIEPSEAIKPLPGDDLVPATTAIETRGITIDAPPEAVWPWLVQMGYGRAGWYSYDRLDMKGKSAVTLVPEWGSIAVGDVVPMAPGSGFSVRVVEPGHALVLFSDTAFVQSQAAEAREVARRPSCSATMRRRCRRIWLRPAPSWAPRRRSSRRAGHSSSSRSTGGRTRLIERFRVRFGDGGPRFRVVAPVMGFGVFLMMRRQMLGIGQRARVDGGRPATAGTHGQQA